VTTPIKGKAENLEKSKHYNKMKPFMEAKAFNPEEQLRKIINLINENKSDTISVHKIRDIIGSEHLSGESLNNPFVQRKPYMGYNKKDDYKENYIS
jgi:hypothetical protein